MSRKQSNYKTIKWNKLKEIDQHDKDLINGYVRRIEKKYFKNHMDNPYFAIPKLLPSLCILYNDTTRYKEGFMETNKGSIAYRTMRVGYIPFIRCNDTVCYRDRVRIHYVVQSENSEVRAKHLDCDGGAFEFKIGSDRVMEGWNVGLLGMRVGGKVKMIIPPALAFGEEGFEKIGIKENETLICTIQVVEIIKYGKWNVSMKPRISSRNWYRCN